MLYPLLNTTLVKQKAERKGPKVLQTKTQKIYIFKLNTTRCFQDGKTIGGFTCFDISTFSAIHNLFLQPHLVVKQLSSSVFEFCE